MPRRSLTIKRGPQFFPNPPLTDTRASQPGGYRSSAWRSLGAPPPPTSALAKSTASPSTGQAGTLLVNSPEPSDVSQLTRTDLTEQDYPLGGSRVIVFTPKPGPI